MLSTKNSGRPKASRNSYGQAEPIPHGPGHLIILCVYLKICLWMGTDRTNLRRICTDYDMAAVAAFPHLDLALLKYFRRLHVL